jgi:hypothetical protein
MKALNRHVERVFNSDRKDSTGTSGPMRSEIIRGPLALALRLRLDLTVLWLVELAHKVKK